MNDLFTQLGITGCAVYEGGCGDTIAHIPGDAALYEEILAKLPGLCYSPIAHHEEAGNRFDTFTSKYTRVSAAFLPALGRIELTVEEKRGWSLETPYVGRVGASIFASSISDRTFFVRLPDSSVVIIDGGWRIEDWMNVDHEKLLRMMIAELQTITGSEIVRVSLWIITHPHFDHCNFLENLHRFGLADKLQVERILRNFPALKYLPDDKFFHPDIAAIQGSDAQYVNTVEAAFHTFSADVITARAGMQLHMSGVTFTVLTTPDEILPTVPTINGWSLVIRMEYCGSKVLWLGDMSDAMGETVLKIYGGAIKSDAVQFSHHGWGGAGSLEFYETVGARVQLWTNSEWGFLMADKYQGYGKTKVATAVYDMPCCKRHIFCNRIKMEELPLPIGEEHDR